MEPTSKRPDFDVDVTLRKETVFGFQRAYTTDLHVSIMFDEAQLNFASSLGLESGLVSKPVGQALRAGEESTAAARSGQRAVTPAAGIPRKRRCPPRKPYRLLSRNRRAPPGREGEGRSRASLQFRPGGARRLRER